ncbi:hypothetical protein [Cognatilysobacter segetis]|uniref:hypothetical protein n=1 Tax=Cognatilysobacter segetis TaxID=2492394 RepID=UPI00105E3308|nr:hypothetical protein [Lysobacter segetis]
MNTSFAARLVLAVIAVAGGTYCRDSAAANVGYVPGCWGGSPVAAITAAGHTPVAIASADTASLSGLAALVVDSCTFTQNGAVDTAVSNGMAVIIHDWSPGPATAAKLPGAPMIQVVGSGGSQMNIAAGSPIATGPGGTLTDSSLDGGSSSNHGYAIGSTLPVGIIRLTTTANPDQVVSLAYAYGRGRVVYGAMPLDAYLPGASLQGSVAAPGMQAYLANVVSWAAGPGFTTCAAEGYTGNKLQMCKSICESNNSGATLNSLIRAYTLLYRETPACAR